MTSAPTTPPPSLGLMNGTLNQRVPKDCVTTVAHRIDINESKMFAFPITENLQSVRCYGGWYNQVEKWHV